MTQIYYVRERSYSIKINLLPPVAVVVASVVLGVVVVATAVVVLVTAPTIIFQ